jgi:hypothetical protein
LSAPAYKAGFAFLASASTPSRTWEFPFFSAYLLAFSQTAIFLDEPHDGRLSYFAGCISLF